ncbi:MAG TPA: peptidoglycan DD-metalloendopeptidase family protein [Gammaproteobacteria bacterium]|nr:peptidoglycan DD-metalloendopeptidase family protein [Gammaproteobacteria bacterium]
MMKKIFFLVLVGFLTACSNSETHYAPVTDIATIERIPQNGTYRVAPGETLYSIAWRYGLDYRYLATLNHIAPPFHVEAGQRIYLNAHTKPVVKSVKTTVTPAVAVSSHSPKSVRYVMEQDANQPVTTWRWPARGPITGFYSSLNKGINIGGEFHSPVYATAAGQVVYNGHGLRGYGHLIIIKHNSTYLSAYAYNSAVKVKEGQRVRAGQAIAEMGHTATGQTALHFELRRNGQPVNPLNYLPRR